MILGIKKGGGLPYARKEDYEYEGEKYKADIQTGDKVKILDGGVTEEGTYGTQHVFKISSRNGDKRLSFNQSTINVLVAELGEDTEKWVDKEVSVILQKKVIAGKKCIIPYLVTAGWGLDEYGELVKSDVQDIAEQVGGDVVSHETPVNFEDL